MKLYRFRKLSDREQMHIEVDHYGEPVEITEEKIIRELNVFNIYEYIGEEGTEQLANAIKYVLE